MTQYKVEMRDVDRRSWNDVGRFHQNDDYDDSDDKEDDEGDKC